MSTNQIKSKTTTGAVRPVNDKTQKSTADAGDSMNYTILTRFKQVAEIEKRRLDSIDLELPPMIVGNLMSEKEEMWFVLGQKFEFKRLYHFLQMPKNSLRLNDTENYKER